MGRKQKLRRERQRDAKHNSTTTTTTTAIAASATAASTEDKITPDNDIEFPKSKCYAQVEQMFLDGLREDEEGWTIDKLLMRGITEYGCVHSIFLLGHVNVLSNNGNMNGNINGNNVHLAHPWFLEGAIRGSYMCISNMLMKISFDTKPIPANALGAYWAKFLALENAVKSMKDSVERICPVCFKTDSKQLTLKQCKGCSMHCYCSQDCQATHWEEHNHRGECKQLKILNKYHKPYSKEIHAATIRGDKDIPALEKLRYKLGLSRPIKDYQELREYNTHDGKPIDPYEYLTGRKDGTVWLGSFPDSTPDSIEPSSSEMA